jgi:hypothetical protein
MCAGSASAARTSAASCGLDAVAVAARGTVIVVDVTSFGTVTVIVTPAGLDPAATVDAAATPHATRTAAESVSVILRRMTPTVVRVSDGGGDGRAENAPEVHIPGPASRRTHPPRRADRGLTVAAARAQVVPCSGDGVGVGRDMRGGAGQKTRPRPRFVARRSPTA